MLSKEMVHKLNEQINLEFYSSNVYLQMSAWCANKGYDGSAEFLKLHSEEEKMHMERLFTYVIETGNLPILGTIKAPKIDFNSFRELFVEIYDHEKYVTKKINELADVAFSTKDYSTFNFLQWYVAEQHEEETLFSTILDKIDLIGTNGQGLYMIDKELQSMMNNKPDSIIKDTLPNV